MVIVKNPKAVEAPKVSKASETKTVEAPKVSKVGETNSLEIYILEDDPVMAECLSLAARTSLPGAAITVRLFADALSATAQLGQHLPDLILLDILLSGPDGFTFLNELISYQDTAAIPVIIVSSLDFSGEDLTGYGVRQALRKDTMTPQELQAAIRAALSDQPEARPESPDVQKAADHAE